ncbi:MAG: UDP-N-acetylmuramate dehydrogenase [Porticoccaceae bacterium]
MTGAFSMDIKIEKSKDLKPYNSLAISAVAEYFCSVQDIDQLKHALLFAKNNSLEITPIGGGSNLVIASDLSGLVVHIDLKGLSIVSSTQDKVEICFSAGENWHAMVTHCLDNGWYGLENLALIPGDMGAAPIQNIGAYGVELCDFVQSVDVIEISSGEVNTLSAEACEFDYRTSIFKGAAIDRYIITAVTLALNKQPKVNSHYPSLKDELSGDNPSPKDVYQAVCQIRRSKLPDPQQIPNVGSFFKNPIVTNDIANKLANKYSELPIFAYSDSHSKLAAAWLIEFCGFKGLRVGDVGVHNNQALVLVNFNGDGKALIALADRIKHEVAEEFAVELEVEPRIYGKA